MAGGQLDSPTCEAVVNASNSPRFDITEFLKPPKDATAEEQLFNFATFNIPAPPFTARRSSFTGRPGEGAGPEPDFSALLFDSKGIDADDSAAYPEDTLNSELIAFDELDADIIAKDSFALFSGAHDCSYPPMSLEVPAFAGTRLPAIACPPTPFTSGPYTLGDLGLEDRAFVSMEHGASTSGATHALNCPVDWGMAQPRFGQSHNQQFQCASCQILRRIIHSNGALSLIIFQLNHEQIINVHNIQYVRAFSTYVHAQPVELPCN
jgi:hypothetical protein